MSTGGRRPNQSGQMFFSSGAPSRSHGTSTFAQGSPRRIVPRGAVSSRVQPTSGQPSVGTRVGSPTGTRGEQLLDRSGFVFEKTKTYVTIKSLRGEEPHQQVAGDDASVRKPQLGAYADAMADNVFGSQRRRPIGAFVGETFMKGSIPSIKESSTATVAPTEETERSARRSAAKEQRPSSLRGQSSPKGPRRQSSPREQAYGELHVSGAAPDGIPRDGIGEDLLRWLAEIDACEGSPEGGPVDRSKQFHGDGTQVPIPSKGRGRHSSQRFQSYAHVMAQAGFDTLFAVGLAVDDAASALADAGVWQEDCAIIARYVYKAAQYAASRTDKLCQEGARFIDRFEDEFPKRSTTTWASAVGDGSGVRGGPCGNSLHGDGRRLVSTRTSLAAWITAVPAASSLLGYVDELEAVGFDCPAALLHCDVNDLRACGLRHGHALAVRHCVLHVLRPTGQQAPPVHLPLKVWLSELVPPLPQYTHKLHDLFAKERRMADGTMSKVATVPEIATAPNLARRLREGLHPRIGHSRILLHYLYQVASVTTTLL